MILKNSGPQSLLLYEQDFRAESLKGSLSVRMKKNRARNIANCFGDSHVVNIPLNTFLLLPDYLQILNKLSVGKIKI